MIKNLDRIDTHYIDSPDDESIIFLRNKKIRSFREIDHFIWTNKYSRRSKSIVKNVSTMELNQFQFNLLGFSLNVDFRKIPMSYTVNFTQNIGTSGFLSNIKKLKLKRKYRND